MRAAVALAMLLATAAAEAQDYGKQVPWDVEEAGSAAMLGTAQSGTSWLEIVLTEGKNRQVRRMCANVGHDVEELVRMAVGALDLGDLAPGRWRQLTPGEVARLATGA